MGMGRASDFIYIMELDINACEMIQIVVNADTGTIIAEHFYYDEYDVDYEEDDRFTGETYVVTYRAGDWFKCCDIVIRNGRAEPKGCCGEMFEYAKKDIQQIIDSEPVLKFVSYLA